MVLCCKQKQRKVFLDTNILTAIGGLKIDVINEIKMMLGNVKFFIAKQTLKELQKLSKGRGKEAMKAKIARKIIESENIEIWENEEKDCDSALLKASNDAVIATNDKELKKKIREKGGKVIFIRSKKILEMEE
ncbi:MAG: nucleotide-binding protein [Candidatus Diapherotrites archaeon]|nr:nucleotide-binding protein [Candidatus Diapherotrites archaeon]